jgi:3-deoxy-manno-octulosonate cytidylyltransferase (CMP-KDO synthetase)
MKAIGIIPARYGSSRFPGKPLADINGKTMIRRVYEQALLSKSLASVVVATDDERIANEVNRIGGKFMLTRSEHKTGTERCLEALEKMEDAKTGSVYDIVVNIQGDEPFIHPDQIDKVVSCFLHAPQVQIATLVHKIEEPRELQQPSTVKVVRNASGEALYFSRSPIPYFRGNTDKPWTQKHDYLKHIGIYAFRTSVLKALVKLPPSPLEMAESLEQLRWLENGYSIHTELTDKETFSIDTPEDLQKIV